MRRIAAGSRRICDVGLVFLAGCFGLLAPPAASAWTPTHFWSQRFGSTSLDIGNSVAADGSGNVLVTGRFSDTVNFGGGNLVSAGSDDIFVAKYNSAGVHQWSKRFGSTENDVGFSVAADGSGNVLVTGSFHGTVDFGGGNLVSAGSVADIFVAKYTSAGVYLWSQRFGSSLTEGYSVAVDGSGNVLVTGFFHGTVDFGGGNLVGAGGSDIFVAKYNSAGVHQWSQRFGSTGLDVGSSVAVDGSGNVLVTGRFSDTVNFGGGNLVSAGSDDIFVAKYNSAGVHQWSQRFGSTGLDVGSSVAVDGSGNVLVTGRFSDTVNFGGGNLVSAGSDDIFVAKYNSAGVHQWSQRFGSTLGDFGNSVAVDGSGNVLVTGFFQGTVNFGGGNLVNAGSLDIFVAKYNSAGAHQWSLRFGSTSLDIGYSVAADGSGNVLVTGEFNGTVNFGGGNLVSAGSDEIFVAKYGAPPSEPVITSIVDVGNDQGRRVKIRIDRSCHDDSASPTPVVQYEAFLRDDPLPEVAPPGAASAGSGAISDVSLLTPGWIFVESIPAHRETEYLMIAPTLADSTIAAGQHDSVYFIRAATSNPGTFYDSAPDSGYSLDNLAPGVPANLVYSAGNLTWDESTVADFSFFTVYGSNTSSFGSATLIDYTVGPALDVSASPYAYYFVTATDFSGNEGNPAVQYTLTGVSDVPRAYVLSVSAYPSPFNPRTTIRYTLPSRGRVTIAIYDAKGVRVTTLLDDERPAGADSVPWDGRSDTGEVVRSDVYFARLEFGGQKRAYKLVLLK